MFTLDYVINPVILFLSVFAGVVIGLLIGRARVAKSQRRVVELEKEMMSNHAEILEIQKAYVQLENKLEEHSIPVISMKINGKDTNPKNNPKEKATK